MSLLTLLAALGIALFKSEAAVQAVGNGGFIRSLDEVTRGAGVHIWEWDVVQNTLQLSFDPSGFYDGDINAPGADPNQIMLRSIHPEDRPHYRREFIKALKGQAPMLIQYRAQRTDGSVRFVQLRGVVFRDSHGRAIRVVGLTIDMSEQVDAAKLLAEQAERLSVTTKAAGIAPWEFDIKSHCFSWHGPRPPCFGMDDVPLKDYFRHVESIVIPEDQGILVRAPIEAIERNAESYEYTFRVIGIDGELHHMQNYARIMRDKHGRVRYVVGVTWDATRDVLATEQLKKHAEENRRLVDQLNMATESAGISTWELDLNTRRYLRLENPIESLSHDATGNVNMDSLEAIVVAEDRPKFAEVINTALANNTDRVALRFRAHGKDGRGIVHVQSFGRLILDSQGRPARLIGVSWDVTEEVAASLQLRSSKPNSCAPPSGAWSAPPCRASKATGKRICAAAISGAPRAFTRCSAIAKDSSRPMSPPSTTWFMQRNMMPIVSRCAIT